MHFRITSFRSFLVLIILSEFCYGQSDEDVSVVGSNSNLLPLVNGNNQLPHRGVRSPIAKKRKNNEERKGRKENKNKKRNRNRKKGNQVKKRNGKQRKKNQNNGKGIKKIRNKIKSNKRQKSNSRKGNKKYPKNKRNKNKKRKKFSNNEIKKRKQKEKKKLSKSKRKTQRKLNKKRKIETRSLLSCDTLCTRAGNFYKQINRIKKKYNIINTKRGKHATKYDISAEMVSQVLKRNCEKYNKGLSLKNLTDDSNTLASCSGNITKTCVPPNITNKLDNSKNNICYKIILDTKREACKPSCDNITDIEKKNLTVNKVWDYFESDCIKPTPFLNKSTSILLKTLDNCKKAVQKCKTTDEKTLQYIKDCPEKATVASTVPLIKPGEKKVQKTVVVENGQIIEQTDTYDPDTGEVSLVVPAHDNVEEATIIMDTVSGVLMTSTQDACHKKSLPDEVDPNDITTKVDETTEPITEDIEKSTYSLVFDAEMASDDENSQLSPTMMKECANKTIIKTEEKKVNKEQFDNFVSGEVITLETGNQGRQDTTGCDNEAKVCTTKPKSGCWRWPYGSGDSLHSISGNGFCIPCCKSTTNTGNLCSCTSLTSLEEIENCLAAVGTNGTCPDGFKNICGRCYADISSKPFPACLGSCPADRYLCGDDCWPTWMEKNLLVCPVSGKCQYKWRSPAPPCDGSCLREDSFLCGDDCWPNYYKKWKWECNGKCQEKSTPCDGTVCPEGWFLCGSKCIRNENKNLYQFCDDKCILASKPCNGKCSNNFTLCGDDRCIMNPSSIWWSCGDKCQRQRTPCDGKCPGEKVLCGKDNCYPKDSNYRTCGDKCIWFKEPCDGTCIEGYTACNMRGYDWCYLTSRIWHCNGKCHWKSSPCDGKCPPGYVNCNGWCRNAYYNKQCNGRCINSRVNCIDKCQVGDTVLRVGESLEYPEKCMILKCTLRYNNYWQKTAVLMSGNMGSPVTGVEYDGCNKCFYAGKWSTSGGNHVFSGTTATSTGCSFASTKSFRIKQVMKKKMNSIQRKLFKK